MSDKSNEENRCEKCQHTYVNKSSYLIHLKSLKHNMTSGDFKERLKQNGKQTITKGDNKEMFVVDILKSLDFENVIREGQTGNKFDIFVKFKDESYYRGIQIKTLSYESDSKRFRIMPNKTGYEEDTLIVTVDNSKAYFAIIYYREMGGKKMGISSTLNTHLLITDLNVFKLRLWEGCRRSTIVENFSDYLGEGEKQETESIKRFEEICKKRELLFVRNDTNGNEIDGRVENNTIQFKSSTNISRKNLYTFNMYRLIGGQHIPYDVRDNVDFFIFEIATEKHRGNFYIIPLECLIETGYISGNGKTGKLTLCIPPPDYGRSHWLLQFLNNFNAFKIVYMPVYNDLHKWCIHFKFTFSIGHKVRIKEINSHKILHLRCGSYGKSGFLFHLVTSNGTSKRKVHSNDRYDFIILDCGEKYPNMYYIIPIFILIQSGYIETDEQEGQWQITIRYPDPSKVDWSHFYFNNFGLLASRVV